MKYVMMVPDGAADLPDPRLGGKTPLQAADTPALDMIARRGVSGTVRTIPEGMGTGSDVASLALLGYDPARYYTGRGPLEAAYHGIILEPGEIAYRCNLITETAGRLDDYSAGHITSEEAALLVKSLDEELGSPDIEFHQGVSYRHLMILRKGGSPDTKCRPPHDVLGQLVTDVLPCGAGADLIRDLIVRSRDALASHPVNRRRLSEGKKPANLIWLWGQGGPPSLPTFAERFGLTGSIISAVDVIKGIGCYAGLDIINVDGATGYFDTDYEGKARAALASLKDRDFAFVHVEAPDEAGHEGNPEVKLKTLEQFDHETARVLMEGLEEYDEYRVLVVPDHATPCALRTHDPAPVPFALYDPARAADASVKFDEANAREHGSIHLDEGYRLIELLLNRD